MPSSVRVVCRFLFLSSSTIRRSFHSYQANHCYRRMEIPTKSSNDKKDYRIIKLSNGLNALLIADKVDEERSADVEENDVIDIDDDDDDDDDEGELEDEDDDDDTEDYSDEDNDSSNENKTKALEGNKLAAAGLCIGIGSFCDPHDIPGLAHLLEHMVFMGCQKFPQENSFDAFVTLHGGSDNASTDCEMTVFYFEIHKKYFHEGLKRFAEFFKSPLLKKDCIQREIEAVDSEFQMSVPSDMFRIQQLIASFARTGHPIRQFMWGNVDTLKVQPNINGIDVHSRLFEFWKRYYSAHYMTLVVQSQESLDTLEEWITEIFSGIPNNSLPPPSFSHLDAAFDTPCFTKLYKVIPVKNSHVLAITWALPSLLRHYRKKPLEYVWFLIGHEGKGSILSYLKHKVWALSLSTENSETGYEHNSCYTLFGVTITLTEDGLDHIFEVLTVVFSYLQMLRTIGPQERIFRELQVVAETGFRWQEEVCSADYVEVLCQNMHRYQPEDYLTGDELLFEYDEKLIADCLNRLTPSTANIILMSKKFDDGSCDKVEPWYHTAYCESDIPKDWHETWKNLKVDNALHLPEANRFLATDFSLKDTDIHCDYPITLIHNAQCRLWYKPDKKFKVPKGFVRFHLISPVANISPQSAVMMDLFIGVMEQNIKEDVYAAYEAMLSYIIHTSEIGVVLSLHGFNHKLMVLFETILDHLANFDVTDALFEAVRSNMRHIYYNNFIKPGKLCRDVRLSILQQVHWSSIDKRAVVNYVTKDALLLFVNNFKRHIFIEGLVQGNFTSREALEFNQIIMEKLKCSEVLWNMLPEVRVMKLPEGMSYCCVNSFNDADGNSVVTNYYQSGPADIYKTCLMDLVTTFMTEPCFDFLRTREQLGYDVSCRCRNTFGTLGLTVTVYTQADKFSCDEVDCKIEEFLQNFKITLSQIQPQEFQTQVASAIKLKKCPDLHLQEEVDRNWTEILSQNYVFDRLDKEAECMQQITLEEVMHWFDQHLSGGKNFRKLGLQVVGTKKRQDDGCVKPSRKRQSSGKCGGHYHPDKHLKYPAKTEVQDLSDTQSLEDNTRSTFLEKTTDTLADNPSIYKLQFVSYPDRNNKNFMTDLRSFKQSLMIYPIIKVTQ